jgi:hypothetical protein
MNPVVLHAFTARDYNCKVAQKNFANPLDIFRT